MRSQRVSSLCAAGPGAVAGAACGFACLALLCATVLVAFSREAAAKPEFAQQTGWACGQCHSNPAGGGKLKAAGEKFKANGFKVK